jgi:hypothetical protein
MCKISIVGLLIAALTLYHTARKFNLHSVESAELQTYQELYSRCYKGYLMNIMRSM